MKSLNFVNTFLQPNHSTNSKKRQLHSNFWLIKTYRASRRCSWRLLSQAFWVICHWTIFAWWGYWCSNIDRNKWWSQSLWSHLFRASQKARHLLWDLIYQKIKSPLDKNDKGWWTYSFWHFCKQGRWIESAYWG